MTGRVGETPRTTVEDSQALGGAEDGVPFFGGGGNGEVDGLPFFLGEAEGAGEQVLFFGTEKLFGGKTELGGAATTEEAQMEDDDVLLAGIDAVEDGAEVVKRVVVAHHHQDVAGANAESGGGEVFARLHVELIELVSGGALLVGDLFGNFEHGKEHEGESDAGNGRDFFGKEVDQAQRKQRERDHGQAEGNFSVADHEIQGNAIFAFTRLFVAKHENGQAFHGEAPHHAEGVGFTQDENVTAAEDDGKDLKQHHRIDDAVGSAETAMRAAEPLGQDSVFGDAVENAVGSDDGGVDGAGQHEEADYDDEGAEGEAEAEGADQIHGQTADGILGVAGRGRRRGRSLP